ncbi:pyrroloquinoline quinone biosynthesis peptide chaperone PqqD, partial [Methylobacterium organophilum]|nr:pyrroloquinoline quinone biosynthesis peptide chaperone PqqD [Methylobacterium organophilum]
QKTPSPFVSACDKFIYTEILRADAAKVAVEPSPEKLAAAAAQNCHVLLYPEGMIKLNESAAAVLTEVDGTRTVGAIVADLQARYPEAEGIQEDIVAFLEVAVERFWIELR